MTRSTLSCTTALLATLLLATAGCMADYDIATDESIGKTENYIVNGTINNGDPATMLVALSLPGGGVGTCTGTMISDKVLLTARHCVLDLNDAPHPPNLYTIHQGTQPQFPNGPSIAVNSIAYSPVADIAVMELATSPGVRPVPMNTKDLTPYLKQDVRIAGYGRSSTINGTNTAGVKRVGTTKLDRLEVNNFAGQILIIGIEGSKTCNGDSGGPAFMTIDGVEYIVGVTSFGRTLDPNAQQVVCEDALTEDADVQVDKYQTFITQFVTEKDPAGLPTPGTTPTPGSGEGPGNEGGPGNGGSTPGGGTTSSQSGSSDIVGGCSVSSQGGAAWFAPLLFAALFLVRRRRK